jgi:hypothetical protein
MRIMVSRPQVTVVPGVYTPQFNVIHRSIAAHGARSLGSRGKTLDVTDGAKRDRIVAITTIK